MANKKINLPERDYYPLDKAARRLGCDVDDLIHFIATGKMCFWYRHHIDEVLTLHNYKNAFNSVSVSDYYYENDEGVFIRATDILKLLKSSSFGEKIISSEEHLTEKVFFYYDSSYSAIDIFICNYQGYKQRKNKTQLPRKIRVEASGLLQVFNTSIDIENLSNEITNCSVRRIVIADKAEEPKITINLYGKTINISDIFISKEEIKIVMNGGRQQRETREDDPDKRQIMHSQSKKTTNLQARVIKRLITAIAGEEEASNPRRALENGHSKLSRALTKAGVDIGATPTCIGKWLADVDD
ncbi:hypothetical protein AADE62_001628 [Escherichia coli]|uniref:hypothetical protein n=1 Tax=Escherichia coli TaxID=562 RepID=UPI001779BB31|nr:hypothetical protein [Escherichia coli]EEW5071894.1 hypothetical protein [Escherichia coli]MBU5992674.1 hypothetical protein [Escherichia coli]HAG6589884.1 hypothetical protein [Escherichia coli]HAL6517991.1 hypothetical protein [Escherichia coli]